MSSELKNYPAADIKLQRLRKAGVTPRSADLTSAAVCLGLTLGVVVAYSGLETELLEYLRKALELKLSSENGDVQIGIMWNYLSRILFLVFLPLLVCVVLVDAYQAKFVFTLRPIYSELGRGFNVAANLLEGLLRRILFAGGDFVKVVAWIAVAALLIWFSLEEFISVVGGSSDTGQQYVLNWDNRESLANGIGVAGNKLLFFVVLAALVFVVFVGVLSRFVAVLNYRREHQMTRSELDAEYREMEGSPEFKAARRDARL